MTQLLTHAYETTEGTKDNPPTPACPQNIIGVSISSKASSGGQSSGPTGIMLSAFKPSVIDVSNPSCG